MQLTDTDTEMAAASAGNEGSGLKLVIGNKNYSSWSMRPWVAMTAFGIRFDEIRICLDQPDTVELIGQHSPTGRVPVLLAGPTAIWDSLAICEYLADRFPAHHLWPRDPVARAIARAICAEMHSGFAGLRSAMSMNIRVSRPGEGRTPEAQGDIGRICEIWELCLRQYGHHEFLFGDFSIADAYYAPVAMRFITYDVALAPALQAYVERLAAHPAVASWIAQARAETEFIPKYEAFAG